MDECVFIQRCVSVDDYLAPPIPQLDHTLCPLSGLPVRKVPVLRVYGATQQGQKACTHVHRVYPYLCIPLHDIPGAAGSQEIFAELEGSLNRSYGSTNGQFIHDIVQISGIPFYGFHEEETLFLKIYFYQPRYVKRTAQLLLQGSLRGKLVQPHEAHFPYSLQFLTDYNIHGMNLVYFKRVFFRVSEEEFSNINVNESPNYLTAEIEVEKVPQKHMMNPEHAAKKCSSNLELDSTAHSILNVKFIDVNCNPGLKAICEEERQRRHQVGNFTPLNKTATPPRRRASLPQTKCWEEKLGHIISNTSCLSPSSQKYDSDVVDFLLDLNATPCSQPASANSKPSSQRSNPLSQINLSLHCKEEEEASSSEDETEVSSMMTQRVFYDTDDLPQEVPQQKTAVPHFSNSDDEKFDEFTYSQLLQLDGNGDFKETSKVTTRKRKRLGARPIHTTMLQGESSSNSAHRKLRSSRCIGKDLFQEQPGKTCTREVASSSKQHYKSCKRNVSIAKKKMPENNIRIRKDSDEVTATSASSQKLDEKFALNHITSPQPKKISEFINLAQKSPTASTKTDLLQNSPKHITKVNLTQNSPGVDFSLSQFDDLKFSPKEKKYNYKKLKITTPGSSKTTKSRVSLSLKQKDKSKDEKKRPMGTPVKNSNLQSTPNQDGMAPKKLFSPTSESPRTKIIKVLNRMEADRLSIESFRTGSSKSMQSSDSDSPIKGKLVNQSQQEKNEKSISQEIVRIEQEQRDVDNKVLMWLSESECSQDGFEPDDNDKKSSSLIAPVASVDVANDKEVSEKSGSASISFNFSKDSFSYSPKSPAILKRNISFASNKSSVSLFDSFNLQVQKSDSSKEQILFSDQSNDKVVSPGLQLKRSPSTDPLTSPYHKVSPDLSNISVVSPVILSSSPDFSKVSISSPAVQLSSPNDSKVSVTSPIVLSGSEVESNSLFSTPRNLEFDTSLFFSQYQPVDYETGVTKELQPQNFKYNTPPPSFVECQNYIQQLNTDQNVSVIQPYYSAEGDVQEPVRIGSKQIHIRHTTELPDQIFYPECERDLGVLGLESWEEVIDDKYCKSDDNIVSMKYSIHPPLLSEVRSWLAGRKKKSKVPSELESLASPLVSQNKAETESLPNAVCSTPINPEVKFSSLPDKFITPIAKNPVTKFKKKVKFSPGNDSFKAPVSPTLYMNSQISHLSNNDSFKFAMTVPMGDSTKSHVVQHLTVMSIETFACAVGDKQPNPRYDPVIAVFYALYNDSRDGITEGSILVAPPCKPKCVPPNTLFVDSECDVFHEIFRVVHEHDPDILVGYEIKTSSLGYLIERASTIGLNFQANISRFPEETIKDVNSEEGPNSWWVTTSNEIQLAGRVIINIWRLMRTEVNLTNYSFESIAYHVLHERMPKLPHPTLDSFYKNPKLFFNFADYFIIRARGNLRLLMDLNIIVRTSEMGRLFGIEFFNVLSRGTQYRVESMMSRLAKPLQFISVSPSPEQRATMSAPELIPLVMEPESRFYGDPVVVLDFQSLYPSMIIAYNMCYSTCLGRVNYLGTYGSFPFGATSLAVPPNILKKYQDHIFVSPNGVAFVDQSVRRGILPMMLNEILETRIMVKQMMKQFKDDKALYKMLDARQMALKLIANVTYGYTSANFSGRMPCIEIGDSIVAKGRETLESAIDLVSKTPRWGGRVVYGDTDSLFILFKGCSRAEAFARGQEIAEVVTAMNPRPIKLRFEKVYQPCVLQTKKRYVGMKFESLDDPGVYEAKGIETVRRDGCPASVKTLKHALHILFKSRDISAVKTFVQNQFLKIIKNKISVQDYIFAKEYRGRDSYRPAACVPSLEIAKRRIKADVRNEPLVGERVQYVICYGTPGLPLIQLIHEPAELLFSNSLHINTIYYITKAIVPPLQRVFGLMGVNVMGWYNELPRDLRTHYAAGTSRGTIAHYYQTKHCPFCDKVSDTLCACYLDKQKVAVLCHSQLALLEDQLQDVVSICTDCTDAPSIVANPETQHTRNCISFVCPVLYKRIKILNSISEKESIKNEVSKLYNW